MPRVRRRLSSRPLPGWRRAVAAAASGALTALIAGPAYAATVDGAPTEAVAEATPKAATAPKAVTAPRPTPTTVPAPVAVADPCAPTPGTAVPDLVASIFRCRLTPHLGAERARHVAAEAVVVAECESAFDPAAVVFDGQYLQRRHPQTGMYYSATGVFQFIRTIADQFIEGGYAAATDPVANTEGAVRLYLDSLTKGGRGWESWECAAVNGSFRPTSVLPGWPGGPPTLPAWAFQH